MNRFNRNWRFVLPVVLAALFVAAAGASLMYHGKITEMIASRTVPAPQQLFGKDYLRILVVGLDYDYNDLDEETSQHSRSDIIMAVNLDFRNRRLNELSVPRDMVATMPDGQQAKINEAQSEGGIRESQKVVAQWLGISGFDKYVVLRIDTMKDLINAIGGVNVYVKDSDCLRYHTDCTGGHIDYDDNWGHLHAHLVEGLQHLNGPQAVAYARFRHDWCSDPCRIMRQQQVARAIVAKLSNDKLNTLLRLPQLMAVFNRDVETNLTPQEEESVAFALHDLKTWKTRTEQVPYTGDVYLRDYGDSIIADETAKRNLVREMLMPPTSAPPPSVAAAKVAQ
jgi:LCP family protein required for cell wall assembly